MPRLGTRPQAPPFRAAPGTAGVAACMALIVATVTLSMATVRLPALIPRLTAENPTVYQIDVDVTGARRDGRLDLGTLSRESTRTMEQIVDQGSLWVFRFSHAGTPVGELVIGRQALERHKWRFAVPPEVADRLAAAGSSPSAH